MKTDKRHEYSAPQLTVVSFKSERGFASSSDPNPSTLSLLFGGSGSEHVETHSAREGWGSDGNGFF